LILIDRLLPRARAISLPLKLFRYLPHETKF
jgi:hypothetical protein